MTCLRVLKLHQDGLTGMGYSAHTYHFHLLLHIRQKVFRTALKESPRRLLPSENPLTCAHMVYIAVVPGGEACIGPD